MKLRIFVFLMVVVLAATGIFYFFPSLYSTGSDCFLIVPEVKDETISPLITSPGDFMNINGVTFVNRGEKEFVIQEEERNIFKINGVRKFLIIQSKSYLKDITPETDHIICLTDFDKDVSEALKKIHVPFYLEMFAGTAVKNVDLINSLSMLTHLKVSFDEIKSLEFWSYKDKNEGSVDIEKLKGITCPNFYISFVYNREYKDMLPVFSNCTYLEINTSNENNFDVFSKMKKLKYLDLTYNEKIDKKLFSKLNVLPDLTHFDLTVDNRSWVEVSGLLDLKNLTHLSIYSENASGCNRLYELENLRSLKLRHFGLGVSWENLEIPASGYKKLMLLEDNTRNFIEVMGENKAVFKNLRALTVKNNENNLKGALKGMDRLRYFEAEKPLTKEDMKDISELKSIEYVNFRDSPFNDSDAEELAKLPKLKAVDLTSTKITNRAVEILSQMPTIKRMSLGGTGISKGVLRNISQMPQIEYLDLRGTSIVKAYKYSSWEKINDFIIEKTKERSLGENIFKSYILETFGTMRVPEKGSDLYKQGLSSFDCRNSYTPMKDHILFLLKGFSEHFDKSFNFHNYRNRKDEDFLNSFIEEKTGFPFILSRHEYKTGTMNSYNKEALKKLYEMSKLVPTDKIGEYTAKALYTANFASAVRKRVKDVLRLLKNKEHTKLLLNDYLVLLDEKKYGTHAQYATWEKFNPKNENSCYDDEEVEILGFLLRRKRDGTLSTILEITLDFLKNYDNEFYQEIERPLSEFIDPE